MKMALWQCEQRSADVAGNLERLRGAAAEAAAGGSELLICPEMFLTGYRLDPNTVQRLAEPADGPSARAVGDIARHAGLAIVWGYPERGPGGTVFNAAQAVDAHGAPVGHGRKTQLYGDFDRACFAASGAAPVVFALGGWRVGLLICYDVEFPEPVRHLALQGADLLVVPTANMQGFEAVPRLLVPARACENQIVVAYANACGGEGPLVYGGLSTVAGPEGRLLAQAGAGPEMLRVDIGLPAPADQRLPYLQDRRADVYRAWESGVLQRP